MPPFFCRTDFSFRSSDHSDLFFIRVHPRYAFAFPITGSRAITRSPDLFLIRVIRADQLVRFCLFRSRAMSAITAMPAIGARYAPTPSPTPYVHPFPPKVTQYTQESAEGRNPKTQTPSLKWPGAKK
jgi:hypothetical protein